MRNVKLMSQKKNTTPVTENVSQSHSRRISNLLFQKVSTGFETVDTVLYDGIRRQCTSPHHHLLRHSENDCFSSEHKSHCNCRLLSITTLTNSQKCSQFYVCNRVFDSIGFFTHKKLRKPLVIPEKQCQPQI